jgi:hypothetical protein
MKTLIISNREDAKELLRWIGEELKTNSSVSVVASVKPLKAEEVDFDEFRTDQQRKAIEVFCRLVSQKFNDCGLSMQMILSKRRNLQWTQKSVKDHIWRTVQEALTGKTSTTKLEPKEVSEVYDAINLNILSEEGLSIPFPDARAGYEA